MAMALPLVGLNPTAVTRAQTATLSVDKLHGFPIDWAAGQTYNSRCNNKWRRTRDALRSQHSGVVSVCSRHLDIAVSAVGGRWLAYTCDIIKHSDGHTHWLVKPGIGRYRRRQLIKQYKISAVIFNTSKLARSKYCSYLGASRVVLFKVLGAPSGHVNGVVTGTVLADHFLRGADHG